MNNNLLDVTAVICTINQEKTIKQVCQSLKNNMIGEIILVDGGSSDKTIEIAKKFANQIIKDPGKGLAIARNIGIANAKKKYILNCGADNVMPDKSVEKMLSVLKKENIMGVGALTRINPNSYLTRAMNNRLEVRFIPGTTNIIGTPNLMLRKRLIDNPYKENRTWSDDSELCENWKNIYKKNFELVDVIIYEIGQNYNSISYRWKHYGISDYENFSNNIKNWSFVRKLQSLFYPFKVDVINILFRLNFKKKIETLPFLLLITFIRYQSWLGTSIKSFIKKINN